MSMKRTFAWILAFILFFGSILSQNTVQAETFPIPVVRGTATVGDGYVTLLLHASDFQKIMQFDVEIGYDRELLELHNYQIDYFETAQTVTGVHPQADTSAAGKFRFSAFTNDGRLTFDECDVVRLVFRTTFQGEQNLQFEIRVLDCKRNIWDAPEVSVDCQSFVQVSAGGSTPESYDCGIGGVVMGFVGEESAVGFFLYQDLDIRTGSFDISYDPREVRYSGSYTRMYEGVRVSVLPRDSSTLHVDFSSTGNFLPAGEMFRMMMIPVKHGNTALIWMENLVLKDQYDTDVKTGSGAVVSKNGMSLVTDDSAAANRFEVTAPASAYQDDTIKVAIGIDGNEGFNILDGILTYDSNALEYVENSAKFERAFESGIVSAPTNDASTGTLRNIQRILDKTVSANGTILTVSFKVKTAGRQYTYLGFDVNKERQDTLVVLSGDSYKALSHVAAQQAVQLLGARSDGDSSNGSGSNTGDSNGGDSNSGGNSGSGNGDASGGGGTSGTSSFVSVDMTKIVNKAKGVQITWTKVPEADGYYVMRRIGSGEYKRAKIVSGSATVTWLDKKAKNGKKYVYQVRAYKDGAVGDCRNTATTVWYKRPAIKSLTSPSAGALCVKLAKNAKAAKYQIQISTDKKFKKNKASMRVSSKKAVNHTIRNLTRKKKYYVRVRVCKKTSGKTYYSAWSAKKSLKTK